MRGVALAIIAALPLTVGAWAMSLVIPTAYEAWQASGDIFQERADRERFFDQAPPAPSAMPSSVRALLTQTAEGTPPAALSTPIPIGGQSEPESAPTSSPTARSEPEVTRGGGTGAFATAASLEVTPTPTATPYPQWNGKDPIHILLLGIDTRPDETTEGRSDTLIVVRIDPAEKRVDMFSIPRDLAVVIPGYADGVKINSAYPWGGGSGSEAGGPTLVAQTIERNFGIEIDYYASVDIPGLERVIDTLGGVIIDVDGQLKDDQYPTDDYRFTRAYFPAGLQKMDGQQAVRYARTRHADGDFQRAERQQQLLVAIRDQALESGLITKLPELLDDLRNTVRTDLSPRQVLSLARLAQDIPRENIWTHSLAPYMSPSATDQGWFLIGDWNALRWVVQNLPDDPLATNVSSD